MSKSTVCVIVPCYGYGAVLRGCVDSVLAQEGVDVRVLIVDDCSGDDTPAVGHALAAEDPRVTYRRHERNRGLIATANEGLEWADGDHVVLLSADDLLTPGALHRAVTVMERHPRVGMVYGRAPYWNGTDPLPSLSARWRGTDVWDGREWIGRRCRTALNCISSPEVVVRATVQRAVGGYDAGCTHASDLNMWLRVAAVADVAYVRGAPQAVYRVHADSMLRSAHTPLVDLVERRRAFDAFFATCGPGLRDAAGLERRARRALARQALWRASRAVDKGLVAGPGEVPVDALVDFALDVCPEARELREWRGFTVRRRLGAGRSRYFLPFVATGGIHRLRHDVRRLRWRHTGV